MKKYIAYSAILVIGLGFGMVLTYINAAYSNQGSNPPVNNIPAPITNKDLPGDLPFFKPGKIGVGTGGTVADVSQFAKNSFVVGGQTTFSQGFGVAKDFEVQGEVASSSSLKAFMFGDPTDSSLWQVDSSSNPREFIVKGYTRAPHIVIGSTTASPTNYNLYLEPNNLQFDGIGGPQYCTLTADDLKNKGCPISFKYNSTINTPTFLSKVIPGTGTNVVAVCNMMTEVEYTTSYNRGTCYP